MYQETRKTVEEFRIPRTTVATIADAAASDVSEYLNGKAVTGQTAAKIDRAVADITDLISFMAEHFSLRPDLKDIPSLREAIEGLKNARRSVESQRETESLSAAIAAGLKMFSD